MLPFYLAVEADRETLWPLEGTVTPSFVNGDSRLQLEVQGPHIPPTKKSCVFYRSTRPLTTEPQRPLSYQSSWFRSLEKIPQCARGACFVDSLWLSCWHENRGHHRFTSPEGSYYSVSHPSIYPGCEACLCWSQFQLRSLSTVPTLSLPIFFLT